MRTLLGAIIAVMFIVTPIFAAQGGDDAKQGKQGQWASILISSENLQGQSIVDRQGNEIGQINKVYLNKESGEIAFLRVEVDGDQKLLPFKLVKFDLREQQVSVKTDKQQIMNAPQFSENKLSQRSYRQEVSEHYQQAMQRDYREAGYQQEKQSGKSGQSRQQMKNRQNEEGGLKGYRESRFESGQMSGKQQGNQQARGQQGQKQGMQEEKFTAENLKNRTLVGPRCQELGKVERILIDKQSGQIEFLGLTAEGKQKLIPYDKIGDIGEEKIRVKVSMDQISKSPEFREEKAQDRKYRQDVGRHYDQEARKEQQEQQKERQNITAATLKEKNVYGAECEMIGKVDQAFLDKQSGKINFISVNADGQKKIVPFEDVEFRAKEQNVRLKASAKHVKNAPRVQQDKLQSQSYRETVYSHYEQEPGRQQREQQEYGTREYEMRGQDEEMDQQYQTREYEQQGQRQDQDYRTREYGQQGQQEDRQQYGQREYGQQEQGQMGQQAGRLSADRLLDMDVVGANGEELGEVDEVYTDQQTGEIDLIRISYGGFMGLGEEQALVPYKMVEITGRQEDAVKINATVEELNQSPEFESARINDDEYRQSVYEHYGEEYED